ncbi:MAG: response regulator [Planctomycetaceae bacterium]
MARILVVDDANADRQLVGHILKRVPEWTVAFAEDGSDALERIAEEAPDVVLTDLQMPRMNGLQLVEAVHERFPLVPVILMTAAGSEEIAVESLRLGAASYVAKKQLVHGLRDVINSVLAASQEDRSHAEIMNCITNSETAIVIATDLFLLQSLLRYLRQMLQSVGQLEKSDRVRIGVALEESLLNAFYHGNLEVSSELRADDDSAYYELANQRRCQLPYSQRKIYVNILHSKERLKVTIRDDGPGFDPATLPDPTDPANLGRPSGRGVMLMRTFLDEVCYNDRGNEVTMIRRLLNNAEDDD